MIEALQQVWTNYQRDIIQIGVFVLSAGAVPLLAWAGTRLTMKIINRGVGK